MYLFFIFTFLSLAPHLKFMTVSHRPHLSRLPASCMNSVEQSSLAPPPAPMKDPNAFDFKKMNDWLPNAIGQQEKGTTVLQKIADNGFQKFVSSDTFKSTQLGTFNEHLKEQTKIELTMKQASSGPEHRIKAQIQPFQGEATLSYSGYLGVDVSYQPLSETQRIKIEETFFKRKFFYENRQVRADHLSQVGVRWDW